MSIIGALSPTRRGKRVVRVKPEVRSAYRVARSVKSLSTISISGSQPIALRRATSDPFFPRMIIPSTNFRTSFAFASVVFTCS